MTQKIAVIGDGAMGTVCALILARKGYRVGLWSHSAEHIALFQEHQENVKFLPGFVLPVAIELTADDSDIFKDAALVVSVIPCKFLRSVWGRLVEHLPRSVPIVSCTKGIENDTLARPTQIIAEITGPRSLAVMSGPNIADELARALPATSTVASGDNALAAHVQNTFSTQWFRIYTNTDVAGVELAGATKNVIAIAAGIIDGLQAGDNAKAALLTRGLVEISRLGMAMGAQAETFTGLSGMGDLVTTCISPKGRNRSFGEMLGKGQEVEAALSAIPGEVEGVNTCRSLIKLAAEYQVDMPITQAVGRILFDGQAVREAITDLMSRRLKAETPAG